MRKYLFTAGAVLLLATPALAQSVTTETTTRGVTIESSPAPLVVPPSKVEIMPAPRPALPGISEERSSSSITNSGDGGMSRTERSSEKYIGTDGMVHENKTIQHEETR